MFFHSTKRGLFRTLHRTWRTRRVAKHLHRDAEQRRTFAELQNRIDEICTNWRRAREDDHETLQSLFNADGFNRERVAEAPCSPMQNAEAGLHEVLNVFGDSYDSLDAAQKAHVRDWLQRRAGHRYELVIHDVMLPEMDGVEVCRTTRHASVFTPSPAAVTRLRGWLQDRLRRGRDRRRRPCPPRSIVCFSVSAVTVPRANNTNGNKRVGNTRIFITFSAFISLILRPDVAVSSRYANRRSGVAK